MITKRMAFTIVSLFIIIPFALGMFCGSLVCVVPMNSMTENQLISLERKVLSYYEDTGFIPNALNDLVEKSYIDADECKDAWGNQILLISSPNGMISLVSNGDPCIQEINNDITCTISRTFDFRQNSYD